MPTSLLARRLLPVLVCAALLAAGFTWYLATSGPGDGRVVESSEQGGWKTIEYRGVRVDVPASWVRVDVDDCEFKFERWAPPELTDCGRFGGVSFYGSATFDPAHRPGVRRTDTRDANSPTWNGYVYAGEFAVYSSDNDPAVVRKVLQSAR